MTLLARFLAGIVTILPLTFGCSRAAIAQAPAPSRIAGNFAMTRGQFWAVPIGEEPRIPMVGDVDGDGRADLISVSSGGAITIARTSPLGKPEYARQVRADFGGGSAKTVIAAACGPFARTAGAADVLTLLADGSLHLASDLAPDRSHYLHDDLVGFVPAQNIPAPPVHVAVADFNGDGLFDVLILDGSGRLLLLRNSGSVRRGDGFTTSFVAVPVVDTLHGIRQLVAGNLPTRGAPLDDHRARVVWLDDQGQVRRAVLEFGTNTRSVAAAGIHLSKSVAVLGASPDDHLAVGRFCGQRADDILVGQRLLQGGDPALARLMPDLPGPEETRGDIGWAAADIDGNGKDDLVRFRHAAVRFSGNDTLIHFSYNPVEEPPGYLSTANDGLPDIWKTGRLKPNGLDLAAIGCRVGRQDVVLEVQRYEDVTVESLHKVTDEAVLYFASLPTRNPDGSHGIALHILFREPPNRLADRERILHTFDDLYPPIEHRGITHWMSVEHNLGVAKMLGDNGHADPITGVFVHEFGHQLGLDHEGHWDVEASPIYHSMMGLVYGYTRLDDPNNVAYSTGEFVGFTLHEPHLSEKLPFPIDKLRFLADKPYYFPVKPGPDPNTTLVDWNWNGVFGEEDVAADINYAHGTDTGPRIDLGKAQTAPVLVVHGTGVAERLLAFFGSSAAVSEKSTSLSPENPGNLQMRLWQGKDRDTEAGRWSDPQIVEASGVTGDPTAAFFGDRTWVAYPTRAGVAVRGVALESQGPAAAQTGEPFLIPGSQGAQPTLVAVAGRLILLLWRGPGLAIGVVSLAPNGDRLASEREASLGLTSLMPPAAVAGASDGPEGADLWIARQDDRRGSEHFERTEACQLTLGADGVLRIGRREWIDGRYAHYRPALVWQPDKGLGRRGRLYQMTGGVTPPGNPWAIEYITMNTAYPKIGGGWQFRNFNGVMSGSAPGACWFQGRIVYALRLHSDRPERENNLVLSFYGDGILPAPMGDFDDVGHISNFGLSHSIPWVAP